jgi:hypothetical protein
MIRSVSGANREQQQRDWNDSTRSAPTLWRYKCTTAIDHIFLGLWLVRLIGRLALQGIGSTDATMGKATQAPPLGDAALSSHSDDGA